ncbi:MAG: ribbon-helix-helix domain-containing protein [Deltaproteobacteria bacterium]|jgi:RHH-type rel operon transcriptional repressor/antitoxin RelB|nr:ribbon-helix-helix domain-containing protein [Deltaproteobacteria bacterium]MCL5880320.1 ribbon-helix-helix domain-containing protein [Deltaproteobacteria bacterium]MDA8303946.1 ribbon-helix-helix domain-containing protein [Deltaproteobacteria bacterium]
MLSLKLPEELENRLENLAVKTKRSKSFYIREALQQYLEDNEDGYLALERLNDKNAEYLSHEEARKYLGL